MVCEERGIRERTRDRTRDRMRSKFMSNSRAALVVASRKLAITTCSGREPKTTCDDIYRDDLFPLVVDCIAMGSTRHDTAYRTLIGS